jgi:hypothetical protein
MRHESNYTQTVSAKLVFYKVSLLYFWKGRSGRAGLEGPVWKTTKTQRKELVLKKSIDM